MQWIYTDKVRFYVWGDFTYKDAFDNDRLFVFCYWFRPGVDWELIPMLYTRHNRYT